MALGDREQSTQDLIDSEPTLIALVRPAGGWVSDGAGGKRRSGEPEQQPTLPRFFSGISSDQSVAYNNKGIKKNRIYILIGMPDDDIQENDEFVLEGKPYRVVWVDDDRRYQCKAEVIHAS